jgi:hypothetical protein
MAAAREGSRGIPLSLCPFPQVNVIAAKDFLVPVWQSMRTVPHTAFRNVTDVYGHPNPDYDPRKRPWYIRASAPAAKGRLVYNGGWVDQTRLYTVLYRVCHTHGRWGRGKGRPW